MEHYFKLSSGLRLFYEARGTADSQAPPFVFLNGLSQSTLAWEGIISELESERRCYPVDLIFQGKSDSSENFKTFEEHADDLFELLSYLAHKQYIIVGISYGGAVAQRFMVKYPHLCKKVFLLSTFGGKNAYFDAIGNSWKKALVRVDYELMFEVMLPVVLGKSYFENPIIPLESLKSSKTAMSPAKSDLLMLMKATETSERDYLPNLESCEVDTLVVHGEEDLLCTPEMGRAMADALPHGSFYLLPKVGHTLNLEAVNALVQILRENS